MNKDVFITVGELADYINCSVIGNRNKKIYGISLYYESTDDMLTYITYDKIDKIKDIEAGVILTQASIGLQLHRNYIITKQEPYSYLADIIKFFIEKGIFCVKSSEKPKISENVDISEYVSIGKGTCIAEYTVISSGVTIGDNVKIGKNCIIGANTVIGDNTIIGDNVKIGSCCSIGTENFEFFKMKNKWIKIPQVGSVNIHNNVYISGNVVIEKGTIGVTEIGAYTQIGSIVKIGHEVKIGIHCHIVSCVAIAGWAKIGNYVDIYGQAAVSNYIQVGDNSVLLARAGVDKNIKDNTIVSGFPAQNHYTELKFQAFLRKIFRKNNMKGLK